MGRALLPAILIAIALTVALLVFGGDTPVAGLDADQFASLAYAGIWGTVLASGLLVAFRGRWGEAMRSAAIWIAAFAVLIGVYAYGSDLRGVGDRMLAVLLPGHAVTLGGSEGGQVMVARAGDDHFHIDTEVNGTRVPFLVDTGASIIAIDRTVAERIGLDVGNLVYGARIQTANGIARAAPVTIDRIRVGGIERRNVRGVVTDGSTLGVSLLGMSFLGSLSSFEFRGDRLVLTD
ncbi:TIGR02281 family clan AA aspartic protease [Aureimonas sp. AU12]|uniref:retropepsin-like aspartic protease family protein n=1 Tax=Aureimonas sp. AU12 TaxID=1638161 RepID=UPI000784FE0B|nr:TIGR02281 family clan AA aspartic protease [Aureimonas sp. AU12]